MKIKTMSRVSLIVILAMVAVLLVTTAAAATGVLEIPWWSANGSSSPAMTGGNYSLAGIAGDSSAGAAMTGGQYSLEGGFLQGQSQILADYFVYLPSIIH